MNPNPFSDTITFLMQPGLTTAVFWVLLAASAASAVYVYRMIPGQRSVENVGNWAFRLLIGCMQGCSMLSTEAPVGQGTESGESGGVSVLIEGAGSVTT